MTEQEKQELRRHIDSLQIDQMVYAVLVKEIVHRLLNVLDERDREVERLSKESEFLTEGKLLQIMLDNSIKENQRLRKALDDLSLWSGAVGEIARQALSGDNDEPR